MIVPEALSVEMLAECLTGEYRRKDGHAPKEVPVLYYHGKRYGGFNSMNHIALCISAEGLKWDECVMKLEPADGSGFDHELVAKQKRDMGEIAGPE